YDANGNPTVTSTNGNTVTGTANRVLSDASYSYTYDAEGNRLTRTETATGVITRYSWDQRNRLVAATVSDAQGSLLNSQTFRYDAFDRRIERSEDADGAGAGTAVTEHLMNDGSQVALVLADSGAVQQSFLYGSGMDQVLMERHGATQTWSLADHLGTVRDVTDASGNLVDHLRYNAFGSITGQSNTGAAPRFSYTGREFNATLGLYDLRARWYDPAGGRFISEDPSGFAGGDANLYRYAGNNPVTQFDPTGLSASFWDEYAAPAIATAKDMVNPNTIGQGIVGGGVAVGHFFASFGTGLADLVWFAGDALGVAGTAIAGKVESDFGRLIGDRQMQRDGDALYNAAIGPITDKFNDPCGDFLHALTSIPSMISPSKGLTTRLNEWEDGVFDKWSPGYRDAAKASRTATDIASIFLDPMAAEGLISKAKGVGSLGSSMEKLGSASRVEMAELRMQREAARFGRTATEAELAAVRAAEASGHSMTELEKLGRGLVRQTEAEANLARAEAAAASAVRKADDTVHAAQEAAQLKANQSRAQELINKLAQTRVAEAAEREAAAARRAAGIIDKAKEVKDDKTAIDKFVASTKQFLKRFGSTSAASTGEKLAIATEMNRVARDGMEIANEVGKVSGKLRVEVRSSDFLTAAGNRFGARMGLEAKPEALKAKSYFGLVPMKDKIAKEGGYIKSFLGTEGGNLGEKFQNWMRGNFYRGDQDIARATLTYTAKDGRLMTYTLNNSEILALGDRMNLTLAQQGHTPSFLHGAHTTMDPIHGGYVDAATIAKIDAPGSVTQFRMDYGTGTLAQRERNASQYYHIVDGTDGASLWADSWKLEQGVWDPRNQAAQWSNVSYNGRAELSYRNAVTTPLTATRMAEIDQVLINAEQMQRSIFMRSVAGEQLTGKTSPMLARTGNNYYNPTWVQEQFPLIGANRPDLIAPALTMAPRTDDQVRALMQEMQQRGVVPAEMIRPGTPLLGASAGTASPATTLDLSAALAMLDRAQALWQAQLGLATPLQLRISLADLPAGELGEAYITQLDASGVPLEGRIVLDLDADGHGWFVDPTPQDAVEFGVAGSPASGHYDLFTVLAHEVGHALGFMSGFAGFDRHVSQQPNGSYSFRGEAFSVALSSDGAHLGGDATAGDLMGRRLDLGQRRLPSALDAQILAAARAGSTGSGGAVSVNLGGSHDLGAAGLLPNGDFGNAVAGSAGFGWSASGAAAVQNGQGVLAETSTIASRFTQTLAAVPSGATVLSFTVVQSVFDAPAGGPQDAFEVALVNPTTHQSLLGGIGLSNTDAVLNLQADGTVYRASGVRFSTLDGTLLAAPPASGAYRVSIALGNADLSKGVSLYFDLLGFGAQGSRVVIDNVRFDDTLPSNAPPVARPDAVITAQDTPLTFDPRANDSDANGDPLTLEITGNPGHGELALLADGRVTYTPAAGFSGSDSFGYRVFDGLAWSEPTTVTLTVTPAGGPANSAPVANPDSVTTAAGQPVSFDVRANDSDAEGDALQVTVLSAPAHGSVALQADGTLRYTPAAGYFGNDSFSYQLNDGRANSQPALVSITVTPPLPPANHAPQAAGDTATTVQGQAVAIDVLANDTDADGNVLTASVATGPAHGTVTVADDGRLVYTPNAGYVGGDSFTYTASDGLLASEPATVSITVTGQPPVNHAPVASDDTATTPQGQAIALDVLANDHDADGNALTASIASGPAHGTVTVAADGRLVYTPDVGYVGSDSFTYVANDGQAASAPATVTIAVTAQPPANQAPVAVDDTVTTTQGQPVRFDVRANDSDAEGSVLQVTLLAAPAHGSVVLQPDGTLVYTPAAGYAGSDSFSYQVSDGALASAPAIVRIRVTPVTAPPPPPPPPVAVNDAITLAEDGSLAFDVRANDQAAPGRNLAVQVVTGPAHGRLQAQADGSFSYTPDADFFGSDSFSYRLSEGGDGSANSGVAQVAITVTPVNDAPVLQPVAGQTVDEGGQMLVQLSASDIDSSGPLLFSLLDAPVGASIDAQGRISWRASDGTSDAVFKAQVRDADGATAERQFIVHVNNVAPTASFSGATSVQTGAVYTLGFTLADPGQDTVSGLSIDWGDGQVQVLAASATQASHVYQAAQAGVQIRLLVTDEDGSYAFAAPLLNVLAQPVTPVPTPQPITVGGSLPQRAVIAGVDALRVGIAAGNGTPTDFGVTNLGQTAHWNVQPLAHAVQDSLSASMQSLPQPLTPEAIAALIEKFPSSAGDRPALYVSSLFATTGGIHVRFNKALDLRALAHGGPLAGGVASRDIVVLLNGRELAGRLMVDPDGAGFLFVPEGGQLPDGEFEILLRTDAGGFVSIDGEVLDGNVDGKPGAPFKARMTVKRPVLLGEAQVQVVEPVAEPGQAVWAASGGLGGAAVLAVGRWRRRDEEEDAPVRLRLEPGRVGTPDAGSGPVSGWLAGWLDRPASLVNRWRIKP
ncbi:MAG: tandem-95 repeat protein, partial [Burkholderiales bacterium]|nr:tandem-95 repeat protein [Burkholderiales bacterium]